MRVIIIKSFVLITANKILKRSSRETIKWPFSSAWYQLDSTYSIHLFYQAWAVDSTCNLILFTFGRGSKWAKAIPKSHIKKL